MPGPPIPLGAGVRDQARASVPPAKKRGYYNERARRSVTSYIYSQSLGRSSRPDPVNFPPRLLLATPILCLLSRRCARRLRRSPSASSCSTPSGSPAALTAAACSTCASRPSPSTRRWATSRLRSEKPSAFARSTFFVAVDLDASHISRGAKGHGAHREPAREATARAPVRGHHQHTLGGVADGVQRIRNRSVGAYRSRPLRVLKRVIRSPSEEEVTITRMLDKVIRRSDTVDKESLCILAGQVVSTPRSIFLPRVVMEAGLYALTSAYMQVWHLRLTLHFLADAGNMLDCACLASVVALRHFRRPEVEVVGEDVVLVRYSSLLHAVMGYSSRLTRSINPTNARPSPLPCTTPPSASRLRSSIHRHRPASMRSSPYSTRAYWNKHYAGAQCPSHSTPRFVLS